MGVTGVGGYEKAMKSMARISPAVSPDIRHARIAFSLAACLLHRARHLSVVTRKCLGTQMWFSRQNYGSGDVRGARVSGCGVCGFKIRTSSMSCEDQPGRQPRDPPCPHCFLARCVPVANKGQEFQNVGFGVRGSARPPTEKQCELGTQTGGGEVIFHHVFIN